MRSLIDARLHPIYLGFLRAIRFEEHDRAAVFGDTLRQYRARIPTIVPCIKR